MKTCPTVLVENSVQSQKVLECEQGEGSQELSEHCSEAKRHGIQLGD
jgi:hypothetical protein